MHKKIYLIDGNNFIYRMFFALPEFSIKGGKIVNATFGMAKFFTGQLAKEKPDYMMFIKDARGKNFRHKIYSDYKATRDRMPDNLSVQIKDIENMIKSMGIDIIEIPGYEADDVIGTLAEKLGKNKEYNIEILTGDKDLYSLVSDNIKIYDTMKKKKFGPEETKEKFGINSSFIIDYLAIVGDKSDNIPGINGFGPKKAIPLINYIGGVNDIYEIVKKVELGENLNDCLNKLSEESIKEIEKLFKGKTFEKLISGKENAILSKRLATIDKNVELKDFDIENYIFFPEKLLNKETVQLFKDFEFSSLLPNDEIENLKTWEDTGLKVNIIGDNKGLKDLENKINGYKEITLDTETTSLNIIEAELIGVSLFLDEKNIYYINLLHNGPKVSEKNLKNFLNNLISSNKLIIGHNLKYDLEIITLFLKSKNKIQEENYQKQMSFSI